MATVVRTKKRKARLYSPLTGHYVLLPATKQGSVSLARARAAIKTVQTVKQ